MLLRRLAAPLLLPVFAALALPAPTSAQSPAAVATASPGVSDRPAGSAAAPVGMSDRSVFEQTLRATGPADSLTVTLEEALGRALRENLTLTRADLTTAQQEVALSQARVALRPTLAVGGGTGQSFGRSFQELQLVSGATTSINSGVSASLTLYDGGRSRVETAQALAGVAAAGFNRSRIEQTVVFNVVQAFVTVLVRRQTLELQQQALADQRETLGRIVALIEAGSRPEADRYPLDAELAQAEYNVVTAARDAAQGELDLVRLLRLDPRGDYRFVAPDVSAFAGATDASTAPFDDLVSRALVARPDVSALDANVRAAEEAARLVRVGLQPRITASFQYGTSASSGYTRTSIDPATGQFRSEPADFFEQLNLRRSGTFGLNLSLPIFDGGQARISRTRARLAIDDARLSAAERRDDVATQVRQALLDIRAAEAQLVSAGVQVSAAERALTAAEDRYRFGIGTVYDIAQARSALLRARSSLLTARTTRLVQGRVLDFQLGTLDVSTFAR